MNHHIDLELGEIGQGARVLLDGQDIAAGLKGVWVGAAVGEPTRVSFTLVSPTVEVHAESGEVEWEHDCEYCEGHEEKP